LASEEKTAVSDFDQSKRRSAGFDIGAYEFTKVPVHPVKVSDHHYVLEGGERSPGKLG
jgi:hypothetical protein